MENEISFWLQNGFVRSHAKPHYMYIYSVLTNKIRRIFICFCFDVARPEFPHCSDEWKDWQFGASSTTNDCNPVAVICSFAVVAVSTSSLKSYFMIIVILLLLCLCCHRSKRWISFENLTLNRAKGVRPSQLCVFFLHNDIIHIETMQC